MTLPMRTTADQLKQLEPLGLSSAPVAIAFLAAPPAGLPRVGAPAAAGCGYWKQAADGAAFYTTPDDHGHCPVGAYTHGVALSPERSAELQGLVGTMIELQYLKASEVPDIPRRADPLKVAVYSPLAEASFTPDVVMFRG